MVSATENHFFHGDGLPQTVKCRVWPFGPEVKMTILVTGGGGFLGSAIARLLRERGETVRSFSRRSYPHLDAMGVEQVQGDLADLESLLPAFTHCKAVFHVAAKAGVWGSYDSFYRANVLGTENVIAACRSAGVGKLVYTSSPSVTFDGKDQPGVDESEPYPTRYLAAYPKTKAIAEQRVLEENQDGLATVSLRPHLIWGPGDNHLVPRIITRGRLGKLRLVGRRDKRVDSVYITNAAQAHLQALDRLAPDSAIAGKAYFISNGEPMPLRELINGILDAAGLPPVTKVVPEGLAFAAGSAMEFIYGVLRLKREPMITRFVARQLATEHWFDLSAAKRDLDYRPAVTIRQGFQRLKRSFAESNVH